MSAHSTSPSAKQKHTSDTQPDSETTICCHSNSINNAPSTRCSHAYDAIVINEHLLQTYFYPVVKNTTIRVLSRHLLGGGETSPPNLATSPQEFLANSDFLDNCLYNFRRDSLIVLVLFLLVSEQLLQVLLALLRAGFSGSANSTVLLKNHGNQILCEI